ncbi:TetR/AcrR family transcriptional regulator [Actinocorallia populi]|uniref:TetR/AcrR family transcriptional regulator n=1 Tax=Actinocorallia populi TaxID=2079200 RepID=UPI000D08F668|nr:TetR/AcrR family transcriptional regulator [Actinocorallia populi]
MTPRTDKRRAILDGALEVFARDGYTRASIDVIAREAAVSTRTIYNHFQDKAALFQAVISESTDQVAGAHIALIDSHLRKVTDLEDDLTELGLALVRLGPAGYARHFSLVRHIQADADHVPEAVIRAWQEAGPLRVRRHFAERLAALPDLRVEDPIRAAHHFMVLIDPGSSYDAPAPAPDEPYVRAGVRAFLYGYHAADR